MARRTSAAFLRAFWSLLLLVPLAAVAVENPPGGPPADFDQLLTRGIELERSGNWGRALQLYEDAAKTHSSSQLLREKIRQCSLHHSLARRYHDASFRTKLLHMPRAQAMRLYDEVIRKVDENYVEPPDAAKLFRGGIESLLIASEDDDFVRTNLAGASAESISEFRDRLRQWKTAVARDRAQAREYINTVAAMAEQVVGMQPTAVVLEFIYGACDSLDDYSTCLTPDRLNDLYAVIDGNFVGIGVELRADDDGLLVVSALAGGPAAEAGIQGGDRIVAVDSAAMAGLSIEDAANRLQGAEGTQVNLTIRMRDGETRRLVLRRRSVEVQSITGVQLIAPTDAIGYVQMTGFQKSTLTELERAIAGLQRQGMQCLVLDLRGNPGGLLTSAVDISDKFLADGVIVSTRGRADGQTHTYRSHASRAWSFPLIVLVDGDSASASEILAGAMQDNRRATVVGVRSYGKGTVQSIFPLDTIDAGLRLTTAKFYSPKGRTYSHQGVSPDIEVRRETAWRPNTSARTAASTDDDPQLAAALQAGRQLIGRRN